MLGTVGTVLYLPLLPFLQDCWHSALFSLGMIASYYILCGIHYPNQQLLESKQLVNLGQLGNCLLFLGNTVIWALGSAHWAESLWLVCHSCRGAQWALLTIASLGRLLWEVLWTQ